MEDTPDMAGPATSQMDSNQVNWNERVAIHLRDQTGFYQIDAFLAGEGTLMPIETAEIGDVQGRRTVHLQCHFGLDSLSLVRRGAAVTGIDFSAEAISAARHLASKAGLEADFICGNVYDAPSLLDTGQIDLVYSTWGTIIWLPNIYLWARVVGELLTPGGRLYLADCHPAMTQLEEIEGALVFTYPYCSSGSAGAIQGGETHSYAGDGTPLQNTRTFEWIHPLSDIVSALLAAGLQLEFLHEHDTLPWKAVGSMIPAGQGMYRLPDHMTGPPVAFSLMARKI